MLFVPDDKVLAVMADSLEDKDETRTSRRGNVGRFEIRHVGSSMQAALFAWRKLESHGCPTCARTYRVSGLQVYCLPRDLASLKRC